MYARELLFVMIIALYGKSIYSLSVVVFKIYYYPPIKV